LIGKVNNNENVSYWESKIDHKVLLINVFFGGIITIGLNRFLFDFFLPQESKLYHFDIPVLFDLLFFMTAFFWVVSQWIIYHELIKKYPYGISNGRFFIDIARFSLMFIILNTSFLAHTRFFTLILTITIWHVVALAWHLWNRELENKVRIHVRVHIISIISYATISIVFLTVQPLLVEPNGIIINYVIIIAAIASMIVFNAARLHYFLVNPKEV
jgi:hypothetical protein